MIEIETLKRHAGLVDRMATATGVDLQEAALSGDLSIDEITDAVLKCTGCSDPAHCAGVLEQSPTVAAPPGYCRNRDLLARLQP
ncbi:hypothetical protein SAMN05444007_102166 [Cribrihabitans marinus]|uniref:DUF6455 domain-containing protein n=1 Tax=Cribrihabitans marinus TaxID=1227549 RepID=A0A1H6STV5_9RHOB|nr:DUF6455 family protein [Cribrihabitans marinus]GGH22975.1 hypothetical protein GCM10010973_08590 [Cribrihabitans marinus]SEI70316.1 hypothetical protein SAMN05444007_102166 [Cribrihabitans marinus]